MRKLTNRKGLIFVLLVSGAICIGADGNNQCPGNGNPLPTCNFITGADTTPPVIFNCPSDISQQLPDDETCVEISWSEPAAMDDVTPSNQIQRIQSHHPKQKFPVGNTTVFYTFSDAAGNYAICTFNIVITGEPCVKPRRYDITDMGDPSLFRGWADVQGQGASNDYCRVVTIDGARALACALAGTEGESQYNFRSGPPLDAGYTNTWYMKDENGDGKDDYCRCVGPGNRPASWVSCMLSEETGFSANQFVFDHPDAATNCQIAVVNPFLGAP